MGLSSAPVLVLGSAKRFDAGKGYDPLNINICGCWYFVGIDNICQYSVPSCRDLSGLKSW